MSTPPADGSPDNDSSETSSQHVEQSWATPTHAEIVEITKGHVAGMEASDADPVWLIAGMQHVMLRTVGRKTGNVHKVALPTWNDSDGVRVVVGSFAGHDKNPSWFTNLADSAANPEVYCRVQGGAFWSAPEVLTGSERDHAWAGLVADRPWYNDYQAKTSRPIPLVRLPETRPATPGVVAAPTPDEVL